MKANILKLAVILLLAEVVFSCQDTYTGEPCNSCQDTENKPIDTSNIFYYYSDEKIFLQLSADKIFIKFAANTDVKKMLKLIDEDKCLSLLDNEYREELQNRQNKQSFSIILKSKTGKQIPLSAVECYKAKSEVISVNYLYQYNKAEQGLTDEFVVKLKQTTSIEQLQELAKENNCIIGDENEFVKNQFMLHVLKTSDLNALQMSNLFYETGLFEFSEPNFVILNAFNSNDTYRNKKR